MNLWHCPKCDRTMTQPECVVFVSHRCNPRTSRTVALRRIESQSNNKGDNQQ